MIMYVSNNNNQVECCYEKKIFNLHFYGKEEESQEGR